jgi:hypothetical protein
MRYDPGPTMRALGKLAVTVGVLGALAGLLVLTKPGAHLGVPDAQSEPPHRASVTAPSRPTTVGEPPRAASHASALPTYPQAASEPSSSGAPASSADATSWREHGRSAVLRAPEQAEIAFLATPRPAAAGPQWDSPLELKFFDLKERYRAYRKQGDFEPDVLSKLHGAAVVIAGAVMPIDPVSDSGEMKRFWLANPVIVMAGCVFCNPPTMGDLVYVTSAERPIQIDPERLFRGIVVLRGLGRLELGPRQSTDGIAYLFGLELRSVVD